MVLVNVKEFTEAVKSCLKYNEGVKAKHLDSDLGSPDNCRVYVTDCIEALELHVPREALELKQNKDYTTVFDWANNLFDANEDLRNLAMKVFFLDLEFPPSQDLVNFFEDYCYLLDAFKTLKLSVYEYKHGELSSAEVFKGIMPYQE